MITKKPTQVPQLLPKFFLLFLFSFTLQAETYTPPTLKTLPPNPQAAPVTAEQAPEDHLRYKVNQQLETPRDIASERVNEDEPTPSQYQQGRRPNSTNMKKSPKVIQPETLHFKKRKMKKLQYKKHETEKTRDPSSAPLKPETPVYWKF
jgi:hypothetical protein